MSITAKIEYNSDVKIILKGEKSEEKQILALVIGGRSVKEIRTDGDNIVFILSQSEDKEKQG